MSGWNSIARGVAMAAVASLSLAACTSGGTSDSPLPSGLVASTDGDGLIVGTLLPLTGSLAFLGPPGVAGVHLAVNEINDAGGIFGTNVTIIDKNASDLVNPEVASEVMSSFIASGVGAIVGSVPPLVEPAVLEDAAAAEVVEISPTNTSTALSGSSPYTFRMAPPNAVQGDVLANEMLTDGYKNVGILVFNDSYGLTLRDAIQSTIESAEGTITYGLEGQEFDPNASDFLPAVQAILATSPEAIVLISFDQATTIVPALVASGFEASKIYFVGGNTADYSGDFEEGTLAGAKGIIPGVPPSDDLKARLEATNGGPIDSYAYAPESYDATMLVALAALKGSGVDGKSIQANLAAVSGVNGGTECSGWVACSELITAGEDVMYQSVSGIGPFDSANNPSSGSIGVYLFGDDNVPVWTKSIDGEF
jgi:ABC-type branched-subunit amino acid transport system substrate-binding protein